MLSVDILVVVVIVLRGVH